MIKNRFLSNTLGVPSEPFIAQALDVSGTVVAGSPALGTASVTVAATTTSGDQLAISVGPHTFTYASVGAVSAAAFGTALLAFLNADAYSVANSITWTKTGTTSLVLTATFPNGAQNNGIPIGIEAGPLNAGPTFSTFSSTNTTGGTDGSIGNQPTFKAFVDNALAGTTAAYWDDTNLVVGLGDTKLVSNSTRSIFYAWKQADGVVMRTSPIPVKGITYKKVAYTAGTASVWTTTFGGTISASQYIHVKIMDTTSKTIPYPQYTYSAKVTSTVNAALVLIAAAINAETEEPIATATESGTDLIITCTDKTRTISVNAYIEVSTTQTTDASVITRVHTTKAVAPLGTYADVKEFEKAFLVKNGALLYTGDDTTNVEEWQNQASNVVVGTNYGYFIASSLKQEIGAINTFNNKAYVIMAAPAYAVNYFATL